MPTVINVGLPSETVSGLSEEGHAGGQFPRPDLAERLDRVLRATTPDLVFACYGINCGIYKPLDEERFRKYRNGIEHLKQEVEATGATLILVTPPFYDDQRGKKSFSYNEVMNHYSQWLLSKRAEGWLVIDLHGPMTAEVTRRRQNDKEFSFQPDGVHPNAAGHWLMARQLIRWFGDQQAARAESPEEMLAERHVDREVLKLVDRQMTILRDAYLTAAGHKRPGIPAGLKLPDALQKAKELAGQIRGMCK